MKSKNKSVNSNKGILFLLLIVVILAVSIVILFLQLRSDPIVEKMKNDEVIKVLIIINDGEGNALATNVLSYYPITNQGVIFNVLGNTGALYTSLSSSTDQDGRVDRIDAVYKERGIEVYTEEIESLLGIEIPFILEISLEQMGDLTDLFGGLTVSVFSPVDTRGPDGQLWLLPSGNVKLDGDKIKTFMMYQLDDDGNNERDDRRADAVKALLAAIHENHSVIMDKKNFPTFANLFKSNLEYDAFYRLMDYISNVDTENLDQRSISGSLRNVDGQLLVFPYENGRQIKDVMRQSLSALTSKTANSRVYVVEVLNGTDRRGLASNACFLLKNFGYETLPPSDASHKGYVHTEIINHLGNDSAVQNLAEIITCRYIINEEVRSSGTGYDSAEIDFTIILGDDWDGRYVRGGYTGEEN